MRKWLLLIAVLVSPLLLVLAVRAWLPGGAPRNRVTENDLKKLFKPRMGSSLPLDAAFVDETGQTVTLGNYGKDRPFILVPAYLRCPSLCNEVLNELVTGMRGIATATVGKEFDVVVLSFDPREKPDLARAKKQSYVEEYARRGSDPGWHFLTGEQKEIDRVLEAVGYRVVWDEDKQQFAHAAGILICTPQGTVARYFPGLDYRPLYLRLALTEAGQGTITPGIIDQVLLPCFVFDSSKGKYSAAVLTLVKGSGVLTVLLVFVFWLVMWLRHRPGASTENDLTVSALNS